MVSEMVVGGIYFMYISGSIQLFPRLNPEYEYGYALISDTVCDR